MLPALLAGLLYLFLCMPVSADLAIKSRGIRADARLTLRSWWLSVRIDRLLGKGMDRKRAGDQAKRIHAKRKLIRAALRAAHWGQTDLTIRVGLGNAAHTALLAGGVQAGAHAAAVIAGRRFPILVRVAPDYRRVCFALDARCIFSFAPGDIILAVLLAAAGNRRGDAGGGFRWRSIRSRA